MNKIYLFVSKIKKYLMLRRFRGLSKREVFSKIYKDKLWGGGTDESEFNSGFGSTDKKLVNLYVSNVKNYFEKYQPLTAVDYGCGDFRVGVEFCNYFTMYFALDIVPELIIYNQLKYVNNNVKFILLDVINDIPFSDVIFIRQVFQHMSNEDIYEVLDYILKKQFKFLALTEHIPAGSSVVWNKDKMNNSDIRLSVNSGVNIEMYPFNFSFKSKTELCSVERNGGMIVTIIYNIF